MRAISISYVKHYRGIAKSLNNESTLLFRATKCVYFSELFTHRKRPCAQSVGSFLCVFGMNLSSVLVPALTMMTVLAFYEAFKENQAATLFRLPKQVQTRYR